eukprot:scaffold37101_cov33-Tisochrysis_lutea.AAC.1
MSGYLDGGVRVASARWSTTMPDIERAYSARTILRGGDRLGRGGGTWRSRLQGRTTQKRKSDAAREAPRGAAATKYAFHALETIGERKRARTQWRIEEMHGAMAIEGASRMVAQWRRVCLRWSA